MRMREHTFTHQRTWRWDRSDFKLEDNDHKLPGTSAVLVKSANRWKAMVFYQDSEGTLTYW